MNTTLQRIIAATILVPMLAVVVYVLWPALLVAGVISTLIWAVIVLANWIDS